MPDSNNKVQRLITRRQALIGGAAAPLAIGMPNFASAVNGIHQLSYQVRIRTGRDNGSQAKLEADHWVVVTTTPVISQRPVLGVSGGRNGGSGEGAYVSGFAVDTIVTGPFATYHSLVYRSYAASIPDQYHVWNGFANGISYDHDDLRSSHRGSMHRGLAQPAYAPGFPIALSQAAEIEEESAPLGPSFITRSRWKDRQFPYHTFYVYSYKDIGQPARYYVQRNNFGEVAGYFNSLNGEYDTLESINGAQHSNLFLDGAATLGLMAAEGILIGATGGAGLIFVGGVATMVGTTVHSHNNRVQINTDIGRDEVNLKGVITDEFNPGFPDFYNKDTYMTTQHNLPDWRDRIRLALA